MGGLAAACGAWTDRMTDYVDGYWGTKWILPKNWSVSFLSVCP